MKPLMQWQNIFTVPFLAMAQPKPLAKILRPSLNLFGILAIGLCLSSCGLKTGSTASNVRDDKLPQDAQSLGSSFDAFKQGLQYLRDHPVESEDVRAQRYLWLDRWLAVLTQRNALTPELAQEIWGDLDAQVRQEPALTLNTLARLSGSTTTVLGKNIAAYYTYQGRLKAQSIEDAVSSLSAIQEDGISDLFAKAQELLQLTKNRMLPGSGKIGVLIPLSGELKPFGDEVQQAMQVASQLAYSEGVEFLIEDAGSTPEETMKAFQKLALEDKVTAIMGPLTSKDTEMVFERAEILQLPVISLAPKEGLESYGKFGFRSALTLQDQVDTLARFIRNDLKAKRAAILLPDSSYGWDSVKAAETSFKDQGISIAQMGVYPQGTTDFKEPLKRITRLDAPRLRKDELCDKTNPVPGCAKKVGDLKPIVDFEVLFVPDSADTVGFLLPTLPYLRIYGVQVVGLSSLNTRRLIDRAGQSAEGVVLTDSYLPSSTEFATQYFRDHFIKLSGKEPTRLAAEAFDVTMVLTDIMKRGGSLSREAFVDRLRGIPQFAGASGMIYYQDQKLKRVPKLLMVRDGEFAQLRLH